MESTQELTKEGGNGHAQLFKGFAEAIQEHLSLSGAVDEDQVKEIVAQQIADRLPREVVVTTDGSKVKLDGHVHVCFDELMELIAEGHRNLYMVGPAGTGKTTLAKQIAKALDRDFGFLSLSIGVTETHLLGRMLPKADGTWGYVPSRFVEVYENGGVFLLDEIDAADSNVMVTINAALANGVLANPQSGKVHVRHDDCIIVGAANTFGRGADAQYVGRNQLDAATLDRFVLATVFVDYDPDLELALAMSMLDDDKATDLISWVTELREKVATNRLRRVVSTRLVVHGAMALRRGKKTIADLKASLLRDWTPDEKAKVGEGK